MDLIEKLKSDYYTPKSPWVSFKKNPDGYAKYRHEHSLLMAEFEQDLFNYLNIQNSPRKHILFEIAWDLGHSTGLTEVLGYAMSLVRLIEAEA